LPDGSDRDREAGKAMLGRATDAAIKLAPDDEVTFGLGIAEGIETALARPRASANRKFIEKNRNRPIQTIQVQGRHPSLPATSHLDGVRRSAFPPRNAPSSRPEYCLSDTGDHPFGRLA